MKQSSKFSISRGFILTLFLVCSAWAGSAKAATLTVCSSGCDYVTIQAAINGAAAGDTINVDAGTYAENLTVSKGVTLTGDIGTPANVVVNGTHIITSGSVTVQGFTLSPGAMVSGTVVTIDSSASAISNVNLSHNVLNINTSPSVGVYVGGGTPTNPLSSITMDSNTFNGPANKISNPWKIGGSFGSPLSAQVLNLDFTNNNVNYGSIPVNLQNQNLTDILVSGNTFRNTDGGLYVWSQSGSAPSGVLSQFVFQNNDLDSTNSYGIAFIDESAASSPFGDANFGSGIQIKNNTFDDIPGAYGLESVSLFGTFVAFTLNAENNYYGSSVLATVQSRIVGNEVDYSPYYVDAAKTMLSNSNPTQLYVGNGYSDGNADGHAFSFDAFASVADALNAATAGDTIYVKAGTYTENLTINKSVTLSGDPATPANVKIYGTHTISADNVTFDGFQLSPGMGASGTAVTVDTSGSAVSGTTLTHNVFSITTSPSIGVYLGGGTPSNAVNNTTIDNNTFNGPDDKISNPIKVGGAFGSPLSCEVNNLDFTNNSISKGSTPLNLHNSDLTDILVSGNTFRNTDGGLYVWGETGSSPTGVLSQFVFTNNDLDSTNSYGVAFIDGTAASSPFTDANFGAGNQIRNNLFDVSPYSYGLTSVSFLGTYTLYTMDATRNWWGADDGPSLCTGCTGTGDGISDKVTYDPWYTDVSRMTLSDDSATDAVYTSTTDGQADMPAGVTSVALTDSTVMDLSGGMSTSAGDSILIGGASKSLSNYTGGTVSGVSLTNRTIGGQTVTVGKAVKLESGTNGQAVSLTNSQFSSGTVSIPDGTTIMGPAGWDGKLTPPKSGSGTGTTPTTFRVGSTVVEVGSSAGVLLFDQPVSVVIDGVHPNVAYKAAGSAAWTIISNVCGGTYASPAAPSFPGECFIIDSGLNKTKIFTYHFTAYAPLVSTVTQAPSSSTSGGGGGSAAAINTPDDSNTLTSSIATSVTGVISSEKVYTRPMSISSAMITHDAVTDTKAVQLTDENGSVILKPNKNATIIAHIPSDTTIETLGEWDGDIDPPLIKSITKVSALGEPIVGTNRKLQRDNIATVIEIGSSKAILTFSNPVTIEVPVEDIMDGTEISIYSSLDTQEWAYEGDGVVENGKITFDTAHFTYFAFEMGDVLHEAAPVSRFVEGAQAIFADTRTHWAKSYINHIAGLGIVSGKSATSFAPDDMITRAELTKVALNAFGYEVPETVSERPFSDVPFGVWSAPYIQVAKENGLVTGLAGGRFEPDTPITRASALKILIEAAGFEGVENNLYQHYASKPGWWYVNFPDVLIGEWYDKYVAYARDYGIVSGYEDGLFRPGNPITRAEVAKVVTKILELREAAEEPAEEIDEEEEVAEEVVEEEPAEE